jgi:hypothetical protein
MTFSRTCAIALVAGVLCGMILIPVPGLAASPARHAKVMTDADLDGVAAAAPTDDPTRGQVTYKADDNFSDLAPYWSVLSLGGNAPVLRGEAPSNTLFSTPAKVDTFGYAFSGITGLNVPGGIGGPGGLGGLGGLGGIGDITPPSLNTIGGLLGLGGNPTGNLGNALGGLRGLGGSGTAPGVNGSTGLPIRIGP